MAQRSIKDLPSELLDAVEDDDAWFVADHVSGDRTKRTKASTIVKIGGGVAAGEFDQSHSVLAQQTGTGSPEAVPVGSNEILGRTSAVDAPIEGLSAAQVRSILNVEDGAEVNDVVSVHGRTGAVAAQSGDYNATQVVFTPNGDLTSTDLQGALVELRDDTDTKLAGKLDSSHGSDTGNPHATSVGNLGAGTLAQLNAAVTDATLDDAGSPRAPTSHASSHATGGADPIPTATALDNGLMSSGDKSKLDGVEFGAQANDVTSVHGRTGAVASQNGDYAASQVTFAPNGDILATDVQSAVVEVRDDTDAKLVGKLDSSHGSDTNNPHSTSIGNVGSGTLAQLNAAITDATLDDAGSARTPTSHGNTHVGGGADAIPGATPTTDGLMSSGDKQKLNGIETGAQVNDVISVHGRTGAVAAQSGDYGASQVTFVTDGDITSTNVQAAVVEVRNDTDTKLGGKLSRDGSLSMTGALNMGNHSIQSVLAVDGRDVSADGAKLDTIESGADVTDYAGVKASGALMTDGSVSMVGNLSLTDGNQNYNIGPVGTVDGRNVGTDGAKLDGIESGADVTDYANVTAAGALMRDGTQAMTGALDMDGNAVVNVGPQGPFTESGNFVLKAEHNGRTGICDTSSGAITVTCGALSAGTTVTLIQDGENTVTLVDDGQTTLAPGSGFSATTFAQDSAIVVYYETQLWIRVLGERGEV